MVRPLRREVLRVLAAASLCAPTACPCKNDYGRRRFSGQLCVRGTVRFSTGVEKSSLIAANERKIPARATVYR